MNDLEDVMRQHLDAALSGAGSGLPSNAAPTLLRTARRRTQRKRVAAATSGLAVLAVAVIGIGSSIGTQASHKPTTVIVGTQPTAAASSAPVAPSPASAAPKATGPTGLALGPDVKIDADLVTSEGNAPYGQKAVGDFRIYTQQQKPHVKTGNVVAVDLRTGQRSTLASGLAQPIGDVTLDDTGKTAFIVEPVGNALTVEEFDVVSGDQLRTITIPALTNAECAPYSCSTQQSHETSVGYADGHLIVVSQATEKTSRVATVDPTTGALIHAVSVPLANAYLGAENGNVYLGYADGMPESVTAAGKVTQGTVAFDARIVVDSHGLYALSNNQLGGPQPGMPTTYTIAKLDLTTLKTVKTVSEQEPAGSTQTVTVAVAGDQLYSSNGACIGYPGHACVNTRDADTLAVGAAPALAVPVASGQTVQLTPTTDGHASVETATDQPRGDQFNLLEPPAAG